mgnify:CR=1 FL=1
MTVTDGPGPKRPKRCSSRLQALKGCYSRPVSSYKQTRRGTNALGNSVEEVNLDTRTKKAFSAAMLKSAERFNEKARSAPEFATLVGPVAIRVFVGAGGMRDRETSL